MKREEAELRVAAAHELGHVIAHIVTETYFSSVWIAGANEWSDKFYGKYDKTMAGCVISWQRGKMTFDGKRVKCERRDMDAEDYLLILLAGVAAEEVIAAQEKPRSIIEVSCDYRLREAGAKMHGSSAGDFEQAQRWIKQGVDNGYFHANEVWGALQWYYNTAFYTVRSHKAFLEVAVPLLLKKGDIYNTEVMTLWNSFYQIAPVQKKSKPRKLIDQKDNATQKEATMRFTELETFVLHDLSTRQVKGEIKDDQLTAYLSPLGVGGYHKFAYVQGRRYDLRGLSSKFANILYLFQRTGLLNMGADKTIQVTWPEGILPEPAPRDVWVNDITGVIDAFKKDMTADDSPTKFLSMNDIKHLVEGYPVTRAIREAFDAVATTVDEINALRTEENAVRRVMDIMGRDVSSIKDSWQLRERFVLELSEPALKAAARQLQKDYAAAKPANFDKMKKREQMNCRWNEACAKSIDRLVAAAEAGTVSGSERFTLSSNMTAKAAHAAWRIEAARRHPDHGGSAEASAVFGDLWSRVENLFPSEAAEVA